jgi:choline dehydrogenase-like flavoprotein
MFTDARLLPDRARIETDLAIIGAGPAGITLARALAGSGKRVCLIESGGLEFDGDTQALYDGENVGIAYPLMLNRLRFFGGSSNHWGGFCRPLDPIDFEQRDWVPYSGWPFGIDELRPYYPQACEIVEIGDQRFADKPYWQQVTGEPLPDLRTGRMQVRFVQYSPPTRFGSHYRQELATARNIQVLLHANVVDIRSSATGRHVTDLALRTLSGKAHTVTAKLYVLATGGLENARMLLLSRGSLPKGLGNEHDLVGRFFMEHPHLSGFAEIVTPVVRYLPTIYRGRVDVGKRAVNASFNAAPQFLRAKRLLNVTFQVGVAGRYPNDKPPETSMGQTHVKMLRASRKLIADPRSPGEDDNLLGHWLGIGCACEQVPNPDSRVMLASSRDALGLPRIKLDWRLTAQDRRSFVEHLRSLGMEFGALGIGRMLVNVEDDDTWPAEVFGGAHHMGTTRMHDDPRQGVVNRNCRLHGTDNLYVAGSSVFPTSGASNPTLTLVALTLRLASHLRGQL